ELLDQHAPARPRHAGSADDVVERHEDIVALDGTVLEGNIDREMAPADADPGRVSRDEGAGDADVGPLTEELLRIEHAESEADHGGDRCERDVALAEVEPNADDLTALPQAAADDAGVRNGGRIRACPGAGEREAG